MFGLGLTEILVILVLVLILFGAGKLPTVMADMGKGLNAFKKGLEEGGTAKPVRAAESVRKIAPAKAKKKASPTKKKPAKRK